jgi:transcriptional regulator with XRE-family HTH domain
MKLSQQIFKQELLKIIDEDGLSVEEIANAAGLAKATLYNILNDKPSSVQRAVVRKVAEATRRKFVITGEKVTFIKQESELFSDLDKEERRLLALYRELGSEDQDDVLNFVETLCKMLERKKIKEGTRNVD